jgi:hypothetical protein
MNIRFMIPFAACGALALAGCGTADWDWNQAKAANTLSAYQSFVQNHPADKHADDARGRILALQDEQAWAAAHKIDRIESYQAYLKAEGGGSHAEQAQFEITALQRADAWKGLQSDLSVASLQAFLHKYPQGAESVLARRKLAEIDYRLQLADARSESGAEAKRAHLQAKFGPVLHEVVVIAPRGADTDYRVISGPMDQAMAKAACATLERSHQSCKLIQDPQIAG